MRKVISDICMTWRHSTLKPQVSSTAHVSLSKNFSNVSYSGMSMRLKLREKSTLLKPTQHHPPGATFEALVRTMYEPSVGLPYSLQSGWWWTDEVLANQWSLTIKKCRCNCALETQRLTIVLSGAVDLPWRALKPCSGTRLLPVTNWRSRALFSSSYASTVRQNHLTMFESLVQCFKRVCVRQSDTSIFPKPQMISYKRNVYKLIQSSIWNLS